MDNLLWIIVTALHVIILALLFMRHWRLLWFPLVIMCDLVESVFFMAMLSRFGVGSPQYLKAVFTIGVLNILLNLAAIVECQRLDVWFVWVPMLIYNILKVAIYISKVFGLPVLLAGHDALNSLNLACFIVWVAAFLFFAPRKDQQYVQ